MSEARDVFTAEGAPAGRIWIQGTPRTRGDYYHHTVVIIRTREGLYTLAQRALDSDYFAGMWDVTGGGVRSGETPLDAGVREVYEELGITIHPENCIHLHNYRMDYDDGTGSHVFVYGVIIDSPKHYSFDTAEVNAVKEVSFNDFVEAVMYNKDEAFRQALIRFEQGCCIK